MAAQPLSLSLPPATTFYVATVDCPRFGTSDTRCFAELADAAAFLTAGLAAVHTEAECEGVPEYDALRAAVTVAGMLRTGGIVWAEYGEVSLRCSLYTRERLLAALPPLLPAIGMRLHVKQ